MNIAVCGINCGGCEYLGKNCDGCKAVMGKVFWTQYTGQSACPVYACANEKGHEHCGHCAEIPCDIWQNLREDHVTDEEHAANLIQRQKTLQALMREEA